MKRINTGAMLAGLALASPGVGAQNQPSDPYLQTRVWAASCAACHGTQGVSLGGIASIAGADKTRMLAQLLAYKDGSLPASVMPQIAKGYTDAELARLADFFSRQSPTKE